MVLQTTAALASIFDTIFPTAKPTITQDFRECLIMDDPETYFSGPEPTGALLSAVDSYADYLHKDCPFTDVDVAGLPVCPFPELSKWCSFSAAAPKTLLPVWSSFGSMASTWWAHNSAEIVDYADSCPNRWFKTMVRVPYGALRLNNTIAWAACHAQANPDGALRTPKPTTATTTTEQPAEATDKEATDKKATVNDNGAVGRAKDVVLWKIAATGLAVAALNSIP